MDAKRKVTAFARICFCAATLLLGLLPLRAQDSRLKVGDIVEASLAPGETHQYTFVALELTLLSIRVTALSDTLDPRFELIDREDRLIVANDDFDYPATRDAAVQALVLNRTSTYTISVSGHGGSGGDYRLYLLPGFDMLALRDSTMDKAQWQVAFSNTSLDISESSLYAVELEGFARTAVVLGQHMPQEQDVYLEADFHAVTSIVDWKIGLVYRYQSPEDYHRVLLSKTGFWRVERIEGGEIVPVRNWTTHPAIIPGEPDFRLGVLASGQHIDVVYNGQVVGSAASEATPQPGGLGIVMRTDERSGGLMSFAVRETVLTLPTRVSREILFPQRILERQGYLMAHDLARKQLAPAGHSVSFVQRESSVRHGRLGVTRIAIASDRQYEQFALGASLTFSARGAGNGGCGLFFHYNDDSHYTLAYMTSDGDFGVSRRSGAGFEPGVYGQRPPPASPDHYLLVIVTDDFIHYYLDEEHVGSMPSQPRVGSIGIAAVNYEAADSFCQFENLWLQSFDN